MHPAALTREAAPIRESLTREAPIRESLIGGDCLARSIPVRVAGGGQSPLLDMRTEA